MANQGPNIRGQDTLHQETETFMEDFISKCVFEDVLAVIEDVKQYEVEAGSKSKLLRGPMRHESSQEITCSERLKTVFKSVEKTAAGFPVDHPIKAKLDSLFGLWTTINSLMQIDRFLSLDQPSLLETPLSNGGNFSFTPMNPDRHTAFQTENDMRKLVIRLLHTPGLIKFEYDPLNDNGSFGMKYEGVAVVKALYVVGRLLLIDELDRVAPYGNDQFPRVNSNSASWWIRNTRKNIAATLEAVATFACSRPIPTEEELSRCVSDMRKLREEMGLRPLDDEEEEEVRDLEITRARESTDQEGLDANFAKKGFNFLDELQREITERLMVESDLDPLVLDLLRREDEFEAALSVEHFEDKLVNKQITLLSEQEIAERRPWAPKINTGNLNYSFMQDNGMLNSIETVVLNILRDMGLVNRHRRDFRLLRDWAGKRPWKQIYQLYDSENDREHPWVFRGVTIFNSKVIKPFVDVEEQNIDGYPPPPTSIRKVLPRLFGFLPVNTCLRSTKEKYGIDFRRQSCTLCKKKYYQGRDTSLPIRGFSSTVVELYCSSHHKFHLQCIFNFWDSRGKYLHSCPRCGEMAKLNYETVGVDPAQGNFVHNNQNYHVADLVVKSLNSEHPRLAKKARELYDVPFVPFSPKMGDDVMDMDEPVPPVTEAGKQFFQSEISKRAALEAMPVVWEGATFSSAVFASTLFRQPIMESEISNTSLELNLDTHELSLRSAATRFNQPRVLAETMAKDMGDRYLKRQFESGRGDVYDVDKERVLPCARLAPSMEAAFLRGARRRREYKLREKIRKEGRGLGGLG
ncbi:uncharacterized protein RSE6_03249 [Rhynchosporium secalis]|uniref:Uncharacterized protein n=1 Tax=Rhynchosporium secalis TaxID=38038 RepID=A0A1E1M3T9_RHYSE|nr:uncharacterized protein RSE6_03249 [Rhynchosporium secalis]